jgi:hypothetical protein
MIMEIRKRETELFWRKPAETKENHENPHSGLPVIE